MFYLICSYPIKFLRAITTVLFPQHFFVDATSVMYLNGCVVDYVETLEAAGFKFENPNVKSTCGCGSSFSA